MKKYKILTLDNKGQKYIKEGFIPKIIEAGLNFKPTKKQLKKGVIPVFHKGATGCGGTHGLLTQKSHNIVVITPSRDVVEDKHTEAIEKGKYKDVTFIYGGSDDKHVSKHIKKYYGTPEMFLRKYKEFKDAFGDDLLVVLDEYHEWHEAKSYRYSMQKIDRLGFKMLGMTATNADCFDEDVIVWLENVKQPKFDAVANLVPTHIEGIVKKHADTCVKQVLKALKKELKKGSKPHVVTPDLKQVEIFMGYAKANNLKIRLFIGVNADYWVNQFEDKSYIVGKYDEYDFSIGTVSATNGIDLHTGKEFVTIINTVSKNPENAGFTKEQVDQCLGRGRGVKKVKAITFTDREVNKFDTHEFDKGLKLSNEKNNVTRKAKRLSKNTLYNIRHESLTDKYGIYKIGVDKQRKKYEISKQYNPPTSSRKWKAVHDPKLDYGVDIEFSIKHPEMLSFTADKKFNEHNRQSLKSCFDRKLFDGFEGYDKDLVDYYGIVQSIVYDSLYDNEGNLKFNEQETFIESLLGTIEYSYNSETRKVKILKYPSYQEKRDKINTEFEKKRQASHSLFNYHLKKDWGITYSDLVASEMRISNPIFKKEGSEKVLNMFKAARYTKNQKSEYKEAFRDVTNNINELQIYKLFNDINIEDLDKRILGVLAEVSKWKNLERSGNREYGAITNTSKDLRNIILKEFFGDKYRRLDVKACALSTMALIQFGLPVPESKDYYKGSGKVRDRNKVEVNKFLNFKHKETISEGWAESVKKCVTQPEFIDEFIKYHKQKVKDCKANKMKTGLFFDNYTMHEKKIIKQYRDAALGVDNTALTLRLHDELIVVSNYIDRIEEKLKSTECDTLLENNTNVSRVNFLTLESKDTYKGLRKKLGSDLDTFFEYDGKKSDVIEYTNTISEYKDGEVIYQAASSNPAQNIQLIENREIEFKDLWNEAATNTESYIKEEVVHEVEIVKKPSEDIITISEPMVPANKLSSEELRRKAGLSEYIEDSYVTYAREDWNEQARFMAGQKEAGITVEEKEIIQYKDNESFLWAMIEYGTSFMWINDDDDIEGTLMDEIENFGKWFFESVIGGASHSLKEWLPATAEYLDTIYKINEIMYDCKFNYREVSKRVELAHKNCELELLRQCPENRHHIKNYLPQPFMIVGSM